MLLEQQLFWSGPEYSSSERCRVSLSETGIQANALVLGCQDQIVYETWYQVVTNQDWETRSVRMESRTPSGLFLLMLCHDGAGNWVVNGEADTRLKGCTDVDISVTPFTNSLPVNRLKLKDGAQQKIDVVYIDVLAQGIRSVIQSYTRLSPGRYRFENVPNDFEAVLELDGQGWVNEYPGLFSRKF